MIYDFRPDNDYAISYIYYKYPFADSSYTASFNDILKKPTVIDIKPTKLQAYTPLQHHPMYQTHPENHPKGKQKITF